MTYKPNLVKKSDIVVVKTPYLYITTYQKDNYSFFEDETIDKQESAININFTGTFKNDVIISGNKTYINLNLDPFIDYFCSAKT